MLIPARWCGIIDLLTIFSCFSFAVIAVGAIAQFNPITELRVSSILVSTDFKLGGVGALCTV